MRSKLIMLLLAVLTIFFAACSNSTTTKDTTDGDSDPVGQDDSDQTDEEVIDDEVADDETGDDEVDTELQLKYAESDKKAEEVEKDLVDSNTEFAVKLFKALLEDEGDANIFISPVSISIALAMTTNGASGENYDEMMQALEFAGLTLEGVNESFLSLLESLEYSDKDVILTLANSMWIAPAFKSDIRESFIEALENYYLTGVFEADSPDSINSWIEEKTGGHIKDMIEEFPPDLIMYLVNAIYFKGAWTTTFDKDDTYETNFTKDDSSKVKVDMMAFKEHDEYESYTDEKVVAIRLPYGRGTMAFYAFAPHEWDHKPIDEFIASLDGAAFNNILNSFNKSELGGIHLPKFKLEYEKTLNDILKSFGMEEAFKGGFDNMVNEGSSAHPMISMVKHKSFIEVTEEGTEAAAATVVEIIDESVPTTFRADKPFFFVIRDDRNGTILFMGKVADPS
jgi:serine protease inhibitor